MAGNWTNGFLRLSKRIVVTQALSVEHSEDGAGEDHAVVSRRSAKTNVKHAGCAQNQHDGSRGRLVKHAGVSETMRAWRRESRWAGGHARNVVIAARVSLDIVRSDGHGHRRCEGGRTRCKHAEQCTIKSSKLRKAVSPQHVASFSCAFFLFNKNSTKPLVFPVVLFTSTTHALQCSWKMQSTTVTEPSAESDRIVARKFSIGGFTFVPGGLTFWNLIKTPPLYSAS